MSINNFTQDLDDNPSGNVIHLKDTIGFFKCECGSNVFIKGKYEGIESYMCGCCNTIYQFEK